ncbi:MAG: DUF3575 domain-containing protein [Myxococcales bacterium]|nr:DUF3575 domain-containing protein [Myxococcales bacterium]
MGRLKSAGIGCFVGVSLCAVAVPALADEDDPPYQVASCADPDPTNSLQADLGSGVLGVGYEQRLVKHLSLRLTLQYNKPWYTETWGGPDTDAYAWAVELRPFIFPFGTGMKGLYLSPFGRAGIGYAKDGLDKTESNPVWSVGATAGYGWMFNYDRILLRLGAGAQYWAYETGSQKKAGVKGVYPQVDIILGWAF